MAPPLQCSVGFVPLVVLCFVDLGGLSTLLSDLGGGESSREVLMVSTGPGCWRHHAPKRLGQFATPRLGA